MVLANPAIRVMPVIGPRALAGTLDPCVLDLQDAATGAWPEEAVVDGEASDNGTELY